MTTHPTKGRSKSRRRSGLLSTLLLLPMMCGAIFCASQAGAISFRTGEINRQVAPSETADYQPWNEIVFAPVDNALLTQVVRDSNGEVVNYAGIATARPTVERQPPVGIPNIIVQASTSNASRPSVVNNADFSGTAIAQAPQTDSTEPIAETASDTPQATATVTDAVSSSTPIPTNTPVPSDTATSLPTSTLVPNNTAVPTSTPAPTNTLVPTHTSIPAPSVNFGADPQSGTAPLTVNFVNLSSGNITSYSWNFGDGTTSNVPSPSHTFTSPGSYYVRFDIVGPGGSAAAGVTINVTASQPTQPPPQPPPPNPPPQQPSDSDGDGIPNSSDQCPNQGDQGYGILGNGCPYVPNDGDGDGVPDPDDFCKSRGNEGYGVDSRGCPNPVPDSDGDGFTDDVDACPNQGDQGAGVDGTGCPIVVSPPTFSITSVILVDAGTNTDIASYGNGATITVTGTNQTIRATSSTGTNSVVFRVNGTIITAENVAPYAIAGDTGGGTNYNAWVYTPGTYTLTVTPYDGGNGNGTAGGVFTLTLNVVP